MKKEFAIASGYIGTIGGLLLFATGLNHLAAFWVVFISNVVLLFFIVKTQVDQINVRLEDDLGLGKSIVGMIPEIMISLNWKRDGKRIFADNFNYIEKAIRGRQFPIALQFGSHKATVVIDCCFDGKPTLMGREKGDIIPLNRA